MMRRLRSLIWKPAVGKYLVRAKHAYILWANREGPGRTLSDLGREILNIARETDVLEMPIYSAPPVQDLVEAAKGIEAAKSPLIPGEDKISYISPDATDVDFDLTIRWAPEELISLATKETVKFENMPMTLVVRRPDYLGLTKWDFRHGKRQISARISDSEWLRAFQSRETDVRPGDALKCLATVEHSYGFDNELISENVTITKVVEVLENRLSQLGLFENDGRSKQ